MMSSESVSIADCTLCASSAFVFGLRITSTDLKAITDVDIESVSTANARDEPGRVSPNNASNRNTKNFEFI